MSEGSPEACSAGFTAALIRRDMDAAVALLADDVVFFYSNGTVIAGKAEFASTMAANWRMVEGYRYLTLDPTWVVQSEAAAVVIYGFQWSGTVRGEKTGGGGRGTRVFRNTGAGWLITHEHLSVGPRGP